MAANKDIPRHSVERYDSILRWTTRSHSRGHVRYVVDLGSWECQCEDWVCRQAPMYKATGDRNHRCKHMTAALLRFWREEGLIRLGQVPILRKLPNGFITTHWVGLALGLLDELKEIVDEAQG
jgi:hypothetical protein